MGNWYEMSFLYFLKLLDFVSNFRNLKQQQSKGLTMFFAKTRNENGSLNGIELHKRKFFI